MNITSILLPRFGTLEVLIITFSYPVKIKMKKIINDTLIPWTNAYYTKQNADTNLLNGV